MEHLQRLFEKFVPKVLDFRRHHCKELVPTSELNSVASLCVLFDALATEENGVSIHSSYQFRDGVKLLWCQLDIVTFTINKQFYNWQAGSWPFTHQHWYISLSLAHLTIVITYCIVQRSIHCTKCNLSRMLVPAEFTVSRNHVTSHLCFVSCNGYLFTIA